METSDVSRTGHSSTYFYVYVLFSIKDKGLYIGYCRDIKQRFAQHVHGEVHSTRHRRPVRLIYCEAFINKQDAHGREEFLKSGYGRKQLNTILGNTFIELIKRASFHDNT